VCLSPLLLLGSGLLARQQLSKCVPLQANAHTAAEELLDASFSAHITGKWQFFPKHFYCFFSG
jgi:hypothetical protein